MTSIRPTTELEAVNVLLAMIEEERVNTLAGVTDPDVADALAELNHASRSLQVRGWAFNREPSYVLNLAVDGRISVPPAVTDLVVAGESYAVRGGYLFNRTDQTYTFDADVTAAVTLLLDFADLPESARIVVTLNAAAMFLVNRGPSELIARLTQRPLARAWEVFVDEDTRNSNYTFSHLANIQNRSGVS